MADTRSSRSGVGTSGVAYGPEPTGWTGWVAFASCMMILLGTFQAIEGLVAIFDDGYYRVTQSGLVVNVDYTVWGWVHLVLGILAVGAGIGLLQGRNWARMVVIVLAGLSAIVNLGFLSAYPIWSTIVIAFDVIVIYALTVRWKDVTS
jgi:hypothetical protein